jgi:hypothetical protein
MRSKPLLWIVPYKGTISFRGDRKKSSRASDFWFRALEEVSDLRPWTVKHLPEALKSEV